MIMSPGYSVVNAVGNLVRQCAVLSQGDSVAQWLSRLAAQEVVSSTLSLCALVAQ